MKLGKQMLNKKCKEIKRLTDEIKGMKHFKTAQELLDEKEKTEYKETTREEEKSAQKLLDSVEVYDE